MFISNDIKYVGVNDHEIDLFEGQYYVPNGMAYNSYLIMDEKVAIMDSVDIHFSNEWIDNIKTILGSKEPDYLVIQHMEPDHSSSIIEFLKAFPNVVVASSAKAFQIMDNFFDPSLIKNRLIVSDNNPLILGKRTLFFISAPMVHWPEVIMTYDNIDKVLFSADGFGKFGALDAFEDWDDEARRYYIGIVGKYGQMVQSVLKKAALLDIKTICPLHGPVLQDNLGYYIDKYNTWSSYSVEDEGVVICYTSVYGNTKKAVKLLEEKLYDKGCKKVITYDLARSDMSEATADAFRYGKLVLATTTYNADIFPYMKTFISGLVERSYQNRVIALIENGSWAPMAANIMKEMFAKSKNITFTNSLVKIKSALNDDNKNQIELLADELI